LFLFDTSVTWMLHTEFLIEMYVFYNVLSMTCTLIAYMPYIELNVSECCMLMLPMFLLFCTTQRQQAEAKLKQTVSQYETTESVCHQEIAEWKEKFEQTKVKAKEYSELVSTCMYQSCTLCMWVHACVCVCVCMCMCTLCVCVHVRVQ